MEDVHVEDMGSKGQPYTWCNNRSGSDRISQRLDRALINSRWATKYPRSRCINELALGSDHTPMIIQTAVPKRKNQRRFKFEEMWLEDPRCKVVIRDAWQATPLTPDGRGLAQKLNTCRRHLAKWSKDNFGNNARKIAELKNRIQRHTRPNMNQ